MAALSSDSGLLTGDLEECSAEDDAASALAKAMEDVENHYKQALQEQLAAGGCVGQLPAPVQPRDKHEASLQEACQTKLVDLRSALGQRSVSYTHLTLPTIYSV